MVAADCLLAFHVGEREEDGETFSERAEVGAMLLAEGLEIFRHFYRGFFK